MLKKIKPYVMPLAMIIGALTYRYTSYLSFLTPFLIAMMLFISYCNISLRDIRFTRLHIYLLLIQIVGSVGVFLALSPFNHVIAEGAMICILAPTATSAVVITNMLGGNSASLTAYSLLCNLAIAFVAPLFFALIGDHNEISFDQSLKIISQKVFILLLSPFLLSVLLDRFLPRVHYEIKKKQSFSFYLWSLALIIITAKTVKFIADQDDLAVWVEVTIAGLALVICLLQFIIGKTLGSRYGDRIAGGQGLGQKNTILAIWMAQSYLNPISSIGPGSYVLWQNIVNSYQVWKRRKSL